MDPEGSLREPNVQSKELHNQTVECAKQLNMFITPSMNYYKGTFEELSGGPPVIWDDWVTGQKILYLGFLGTRLSGEKWAPTVAATKRQNRQNESGSRVGLPWARAIQLRCRGAFAFSAGAPQGRPFPAPGFIVEVDSATGMPKACWWGALQAPRLRHVL